MDKDVKNLVLDWHLGLMGHWDFGHGRFYPINSIRISDADYSQFMLWLDGKIVSPSLMDDRLKKLWESLPLNNGMPPLLKQILEGIMECCHEGKYMDVIRNNNMRYILEFNFPQPPYMAQKNGRVYVKMGEKDDEKECRNWAEATDFAVGRARLQDLFSDITAWHLNDLGSWIIGSSIIFNPGRGITVTDKDVQIISSYLYGEIDDRNEISNKDLRKAFLSLPSAMDKETRRVLAGMILAIKNQRTMYISSDMAITISSGAEKTLYDIMSE